MTDMVDYFNDLIPSQYKLIGLGHIFLFKNYSYIYLSSVTSQGISIEQRSEYCKIPSYTCVDMKSYFDLYEQRFINVDPPMKIENMNLSQGNFNFLINTPSNFKIINCTLTKSQRNNLYTKGAILEHCEVI